MKLTSSNNVHTITVCNIPGPSLPATGGPGTGVVFCFGGVMIALAGIALFLSRRRRRDARG